MLSIVVFIVLALASALPAPVRPASAAQSQGPIAFTGVRWSSQSIGTAIYLIRADGTGLRKLVTNANEPAWTRDGKRLAFGRMTNSGWRLWVANANGTGAHPVSALASLADQPSWSPDGRHIALTWMRKNIPQAGVLTQQVYVLDTTSGKLRKITSSKGGAGNPDWSPDGKRIAFAGSTSLAEGPSNVYSVRPDGSGLKLLVSRGGDPVFAPDGRSIAFSRAGDIYTASASGRDVRRVTNTPKLGETHPNWSADGRQLVFATMRRAKDQANDDQRLSIVDVSSGRLRTITDRNPQFWADAPVWKPAR